MRRRTQAEKPPPRRSRRLGTLDAGPRPGPRDNRRRPGNRKENATAPGPRGVPAPPDLLLLRDILDRSPAMVFVKDLRGRYLYANAQFKKLNRLSRGSILGRTDEELFPAEQAAAFRVNDQLVQESGRASVFEEVARHPDGPHTSVVTKYPLRDSKGEVCAICGIVTDITERQRAESMFRGLVNAAPDATVVVNAAGKIIVANEQLENLFGYRREELLGKGLEILVPERFRGVHDRHRRGFLDNPQFRPMGAGLELHARRKDGTEFPVDISLSPLRTHQGLVVSAAIRDITLRKQREEALRESEARTRALVESMDDVAFEIDEHGTYIGIWTSNESLLPRPKREMVGARVGDFLGKDFVRPFYKAFEQVWRTGKPQSVEYDLTLAGRKRWFMGRISPIPVGQGVPKRVCLLVREITALKRSEESLRKLSGLLLRLQDEERRRLAHDLHDSTSPPLTSLVGKLYRLKKQWGEFNAESFKMLDESLTLAEHTSTVIRGVSDLLHPPMLEKQGLVASLRWYLDRLAKQSGFRTELSLPRELPALPEGAGIALFRIVQDSLLGVFRYPSKAAKQVRLELQRDGLCLEIADQGHRLPPDILDRLAPGADDAGLSIMRERMQQLGGSLKIRLDDAETAIVAFLPLKPSAE